MMFSKLIKYLQAHILTYLTAGESLRIKRMNKKLRDFFQLTPSSQLIWKSILSIKSQSINDNNPFFNTINDKSIHHLIIDKYKNTIDKPELLNALAIYYNDMCKHDKLFIITIEKNDDYSLTDLVELTSKLNREKITYTFGLVTIVSDNPEDGKLISQILKNIKYIEYRMNHANYLNCFYFIESLIDEKIELVFKKLHYEVSLAEKFVTYFSMFPNHLNEIYIADSYQANDVVLEKKMIELNKDSLERIHIENMESTCFYVSQIQDSKCMIYNMLPFTFILAISVEETKLICSKLLRVSIEVLINIEPLLEILNQCFNLTTMEFTCYQNQIITVFEKLNIPDLSNISIFFSGERVNNPDYNRLFEILLRFNKLKSFIMKDNRNLSNFELFNKVYFQISDTFCCPSWMKLPTSFIIKLLNNTKNHNYYTLSSNNIDDIRMFTETLFTVDKDLLMKITSIEHKGILKGDLELPMLVPNLQKIGLHHKTNSKVIMIYNNFKFLHKLEVFEIDQTEPYVFEFIKENKVRNITCSRMNKLYIKEILSNPNSFKWLAYLDIKCSVYDIYDIISINSETISGLSNLMYLGVKLRLEQGQDNSEAVYYINKYPGVKFIMDEDY